MNFISELKRRNVLRVAAANALVCWILIESGSVLLPTFGAPAWFFKIYVILIAAGFVASLIIAWVFEITPEGVKLESDVDRSTYVPPKRGRLNVAIIALLAIALGVSLTFNLTGMRDHDDDIEPGRRHDSIAVLPFASLSTDPENQFFTDGIHADLLTRLAETSGLRVISGTSVAEYRETTKNIRQIGSELDVDTIVEGAVQRSGDQVRISVNLVDASTDEPIWTHSYDRRMSMQNVFDIQREISTQIAMSLQSALSPEKQQRLAEVPTMNVEAYAQYVAGRNNLALRRFDTLMQAREQFERAIELDPQYAAAYAGLAETVMVLLTNHRALVPGQAFTLAEEAVNKALQYDARLAEAYAVQGLVELSRWQETRGGPGNQLAAASFQRAIELNPNLANAYVWFSSLREAESDIEAAIELLTEAIRIDPLSRIPYVNLPGLFFARGEDDRAVRIWLKAMDIFPDWPTPIQYLSKHLSKLGRLDEAIAWYQLVVPLTDDPMAEGEMVGVLMDLGMADPLREFMERFPADHPLYPLGRGFEYFYSGDYAASLQQLESVPNLEEMPAQIVYPLMAAAAVYLDDYDKAHEYILHGNPALAVDTRDAVDRFNIGAAVFLAYVQQNRNQHTDAARLLRQAEAVLNGMPRMGWSGHGIRDVQIFALQGRTELALDRLRDAVDAGFVSLLAYDQWGLDQDPLIDSLRGEPRYAELRDAMEARIAVMRENVETAKNSGDWEPLRSRIARSERT